MNDRNRRIITILSIFTIIFTLAGGTLAYYNWTSDIRTGVAFTITKDFSCSADGGQDLNATNIALQPTADCTNSETAIQRTIKVTPNIKRDGVSINLDMWLKVNNIGSGLAASDNFRYAISTVEGSCKSGMEGYITSGNFKDLTTGDKVELLNDKKYTATTTDTYYLYIWLSEVESNPNTMNQTFDLSLGGECSDYLGQAEVPVLDDGMIPVTIANDGKLTIVSEEDDSWYNYDEKQWANVVLVNEDATVGVENSHPRSYYQSAENVGKEVTQDDVLAYYVWIPRYKYKMPQTKCSSIENPTMEENPECYAPYTLSNDEKNALIRYVSDKTFGLLPPSSYTEEQVNSQSLKDINLALETGRLSDKISIISYIDDYNTSLEKGSYPWSGETMTGSEITLTESDFNSKTTYPTREGTIDISFEAGSYEMTLGNATTEYKTHPAFWWDHDNDNFQDNGELLSGIWVGKFETTISGENPTILPNSKADLYKTLNDQFLTSRNISNVGNIYGLDNETINAHLIKNRDWGAVAYLSHSEYGINTEISNYAANYGTLETYPQSTTGNISGIFDMVGNNETVMAHYGDEKNSGGYTVEENSGFEELPDLKYYDLYSKTDFPGTQYGNLVYCTVETCGGHALNETVGWYYNDYDYLEFIDSAFPWISRGNSYNGGLFGNTWLDDTIAFSMAGRSVLVPGFGD